MVIPPYAAEVSWADVVGDEIAVVGELLFADAANAVLDDDLAVGRPRGGVPHIARFGRSQTRGLKEMEAGGSRGGCPWKCDSILRFWPTV